jgi:uncharacterized protein (TIRG00374 family)
MSTGIGWNCMSYLITKKRIRRGLQIFTLMSLSSLIVIFLLTRSHMTVEAFTSVQPLWLLAALPFIGLDWLSGGYRIYVFSRILYPPIRFKTCMKANLANYFLGAVTPSQTGGGPGQIYMLYRGGMPVVEATSASLMTFFSTVFFLIVAGAGVFAFKGFVPLPGRLLGRLFTAGVLFFLVIALLVVIAVAFPGFYRELMRLVVLAVSRLRKRDYLRAGSWAHRMLDFVDRCHGQLIHYLQKQWHVFILGVAVSGVCFLSKFVVAFAIVRSFGLRASFVHVALLQMVIVLINYFFPSPGASGAAEFSAAALMTPVVTTGFITFYVVLWRLFTTYVVVAVGGGVMLHELGKKEKIEIDGGLGEAIEAHAAPRSP